ncbi:hypothetical protein [Halosimplex sp. J119]
MVGVAAGHPAGEAPQSDAIAIQQDEATQANNTTAQRNASEPVSLSIENVTRCGSRCRLVTANLTNTGNETLETVTADTKINAGDRDVWSRTHRFGNVSANESTNRTARIRLSFGEALAIASNDGRIAINSTVRWEGGNATFSERRRVMG